jgi:hypothetical protein
MSNLVSVSTETWVQWIGAGLFALALVHTFCTAWFERLAHRQPAHAGLWHLLGEVEVVFGFWALVLMLVMFWLQGKPAATAYLDTRNFTEPLFVFTIMVMAGTRPVMQVAAGLAQGLAGWLPLAPLASITLVTLSVVPLLGSFITEPAAMTLAALMLRDGVLGLPGASMRLKYAVLGVLFVNVSIGGTLTPFAAPPVLMVAHVWQWDMPFMLRHFGGQAALAVLVNALGLVLVFRKAWPVLAAQPAGAEPASRPKGEEPPVPVAVALVHLVFLAGVVVFSHHPAVFLGLFLFFLGFTQAYERYQSPLILREALLVGFFLAGLVVLGGVQQWWLQPVLLSMNAEQVFLGATALTAFTDNAALTYLGSLVPGLSDGFKVALVAGAVSGGGLTVVANAPNPAGVSLLRTCFDEGTVQPLGLLAGAALPTLVAMAAFRWL